MKVKNSLAQKPTKPKKSAMTLSLVNILDPAGVNQQAPYHPKLTLIQPKKQNNDKLCQDE